MPAELIRFLLIDGHSVIHAWEDLRRLHARSAQRYMAREELLKRMRLLQDMTGERVVVVFDGTGSKIQEEREKDGLQIFYADGSHTADFIIERLAAQHAGLYPLRVCTADRMIWETVRAFSGGWISPDDLKGELERATCSMRNKLRKK